jgi:hypothetical protein
MPLGFDKLATALDRLINGEGVDAGHIAQILEKSFGGAEGTKVQAYKGTKVQAYEGTGGGVNEVEPAAAHASLARLRGILVLLISNDVEPNRITAVLKSQFSAKPQTATYS